MMSELVSEKAQRAEAAYTLADCAYGLIKRARADLLEAVRADPTTDHMLEPIWRALARVGGELGAVVDRIGDEIELGEERERDLGKKDAKEGHSAADLDKLFGGVKK
jgi:hypothetical protein